MAWTTLTSAQLRARLAAAEVAALKNNLTAGDSDPLAAIVVEAVGTVRGYIAANSANQLGAGDTVPSVLVDTALVLARHRLLTRLPVPSLITEGRRTEHADALKLLADVAAGRFAVEQPATPTTEASSGPGAALVSSSARKAGRTHLAGL